MKKQDEHFNFANVNRCITRVSIALCFVLFGGGGVYASAQSVKLSLTLNKQTMSEAIEQIAKESQLDFFYSQHQVDAIDKIVTVEYTSTKLSEILGEVLSGTEYTHKFEDNGVVIVPRPSESIILQQKEKVELKGKVINRSTKESLPGATIVVSGTSHGAITDADGNFKILISPDNKEIEVTFVGYNDVKVNVQGKKEVVIEMYLSLTKIEEVVVTGVFTRNQNTYSGAVNTIKAEALARTGSLNIIQALGNIDPSFSVLQNNEMGSDPNATPDIQMRGAGSFSDMKGSYTSSPNQPLFIVDGFEQSIEKVLDMDMNRVNSVTLLKDATAKAIYGSKGANGVVVIETKIPEKGALKFSYKGDLNIQIPDLGSYSRANAAEKLEIERRAGLFTSTDPKYQFALDEEYNEIYKEVLRGVDTDWLAKPTRVGVGQKHSINIEGGDDAIRYNVNIAYNDVQGVMKGSHRKTFEGGFNLQYRYKNLVFKEQFTLLSNKSADSPYGSFADYAKMNPYWRAHDENGNVTRKLGYYDALQSAAGSMDIYNPMLNAESNYKNTSNYYDFTNNFYIEWKATHEFKLVGRVGITKRSGQDDLFYPTNYTTLDPLSTLNFISVTPDDDDDAYFKRGLYQQTANDMFNLSSDITLSYSKQIEKHLVFANAQYTVSTNNSTTTSFEGEGFADNATEITQARQYKESARPGGFDNKVHEIGAIASVNYSYDSRYLFDANYRANASSLFGINNRWGHFWSVGAGWNLHNEKFMENVSWLDLFKLRSSFGYTGSQNFASYQAIATYSFFNDDIYDNVIGAYLLAMHNPDLQWQLTEDQNIGFDMTIFDKIDLTFDYYVKNTSNLLTPITATPSIGFNTFIENLGKSKNEGVEARINYRAISGNDIYLSFFGSVAHNTNKLVEINEALASINDVSDEAFDNNTNEHYSDKVTTQPRVKYAEGVSLSAIWVVPSLGIDPLNGKEIFIKQDGSHTYDWDAADQRPMGDALPKVQGTYGFNLDYKGFTTNAIFSYRLGGQYYNQTLVDNVENADLRYNVDSRILDGRWNPLTPGVATPYKAMEENPRFTDPTSRFIQDYDELTLSSLNIGYDFRNCNFMKKSQSVERLRLSFAMNNLFRLSTVKAERGTIYPYAQSFICTVHATF